MASTTPLVVKAKAKKYLLVLPAVGVPYVEECSSGNKELRQLQKIVGGYIESHRIEYYYVPAALIYESPKWKTVAKLIRKPLGRYVYCNEEGGTHCPKNMALCLVDMKGMRHGLSENPYGNIVITLTEKKMIANGIVAAEWLKIDNMD